MEKEVLIQPALVAPKIEKLTAICLLDILPDELLLLIISFCSPSSFADIQAVSKRWNCVCDDESLWQTVYTLRWVELREDHLVGQVKERLRPLDLKHCQTWKMLFLRTRYPPSYALSLPSTEEEIESNEEEIEANEK